MDDKKVGELWRNCLIGQKHGYAVQHEIDLIRKLVEERARSRESDGPWLGDFKVIDAALRDFGIDPGTFK